EISLSQAIRTEFSYRPASQFDILVFSSFPQEDSPDKCRSIELWVFFDCLFVLMAREDYLSERSCGRLIFSMWHTDD
ncbi:Bgt-20845, partial [Blumeria graminis f. sp. tritici]